MSNNQSDLEIVDVQADLRSQIKAGEYMLKGYLHSLETASNRLLKDPKNLEIAQECLFYGRQVRSLKEEISKLRKLYLADYGEEAS